MRAMRQAAERIHAGSSFTTFAAVLHRTTAIYQQGTSKVSFLFILTNIKSIAFPERLPINIPEFISSDVSSVFLNSTLNPLCGERCRPEQKPSTTCLANSCSLLTLARSFGLTRSNIRIEKSVPGRSGINALSSLRGGLTPRSKV